MAVTDQDKKFLNYEGLAHFKDKNDANYIGEIKVNNTAVTKDSTRKNGASVNIAVPVQGTVSAESTTGYVSGAQVQTAIDEAIGGGEGVVHQAFKTFGIKQGSSVTNIVAGSTNDTMTIEAGTKITLTPDASNKKFTINGVLPTLSELGITASASDINTTASSGITSTKVGNYDNHISNTSNPHGVTKAQVGLGSVTDNKQVKGLSSGTTSGHIVTWGSDGYTVADSGKTVADFATAEQGTAIDNHISRTDNPHSVTKAQVGLGNVTNNAQVKGLSNGTTSGHIVTWGADGYTVADSGKSVSDFATSAQGTLAENAMPKSGGTFTGAVTLSGAPTTDLGAATKKYVDDAVNGLPTPMQFKGTVGTSGTIEWSALPTASSANEGYTYKVLTDHATAPVCEAGDTIVSNGSTWIVIPSGDEPSGTVTNIVTGTGLTGGPITTTGTISLATLGTAGTAGQTTAQSVAPGTAFKIPYVTVDAYGRVSAYGTSNVTVSNPTAITNSEIDELFATA